MAHRYIVWQMKGPNESCENALRAIAEKVPGVTYKPRGLAFNPQQVFVVTSRERDLALELHQLNLLHLNFCDFGVV